MVKISIKYSSKYNALTAFDKWKLTLLTKIKQLI
jgi:hypothetical protein